MRFWKPITVYTLTDPRTGLVRYVGATTNVESRFRQHQFGKNGGNWPREVWIRELHALGLKPICDVLETAKEFGYAIERKWIAYYLACGAALTNVRDTPAEVRWPNRKPQPDGGRALEVVKAEARP